MRAVVLALSLVLVTGQSFHFAPEFAPGKTFVYKYEAVMMSGMPADGLAKAGIKFSSKVFISADSENVYLLKLVEPEFYEFSGISSKDHFIRAEKLTASMAPQFATPIKFEYVNGVVGKIFAPEGVSTMVLNIYRGILNVFQMNIKKTHNVYELQEAGAQGVCKTLYAISEDEKAERILLTKTRDLNNCQEKIIKDLGLAYMVKCDNCQQNSKNLRGATAFNYVLKPVANGIMILEATVNELIQFSPFTEINGATQMQTRQILVFHEVQNVPLVAVEAQYFHHGSLKYEFSNEIFQMPIQLFKVNNVRQTLNDLVENTLERVREDAPQKFLELIQLLRSARYEDLEIMWNYCKKRPVYRQWFLDAIPAIGTAASLRFIKEKFMIDDLRVSEVAQALVASTHLVTANSETIKIFEALIDNNKIKENAVLSQIALLGFGTMVSKYCKEQAHCPSELLKPIQDLLAEAVTKQDIQAIILLLKVLGNAGHPTSLKPITKLLPIHGTAAVTLPMTVHADAIMALTNIAQTEPRMIQDLALQLYMDKALHPELRMLACIVLFETRPAIGLVTTLANIVKSEENLQVASFTFSHMKSMTKSTAAIHASLAAACNVAIKILSPKLNRLSLKYSKAIHMDIYKSPLMLGAASSTFFINDAATTLPRSFMTKTSAYIAGAAANVLELGIRTEGLQEALLKNPTLINNLDRMSKMKRVIKAISELRNIPARTPLASVYVKLFGQEIAFANFDKGVIDQVLAYISHPSIETITKSAFRYMMAGVSLNYVKPLLASEMRRIMPTAAGLPMELSLYTAAVAAAGVQVKFATSPAIPENFKLAHLLETDILLETEVKPSLAVNTFAVMGINTAMIQAGTMSKAKFNSILPAKITARLDIKEGNYKFEVLPVPENVAAVHFETFAVATNIEDLTAAKITPIISDQAVQSVSGEMHKSETDSSNAASTSQSSEIAFQAGAFSKPIIKPRMSKFDKKYCAKVFGFGLKCCLKVATDNAAFIRDIALYKLVGKHSVTLSLKPIGGEPIERLEMEIQIGPKAVEKLIEQINLSEEEITEVKPVLKKLMKILAPEMTNVTSTSSSSSSSSRHGISSSSSSATRHGSSSSRSSSSGSLRRSLRSSSASSLASFFSGSSSSSQASTHLSKQIVVDKFQKNHNKQAVNSQGPSVITSRSRSSGSSFEAVYRKNKFLGNDLVPTFSIIIRVILADKKVTGYQLAAYLDKPTARIQVILAPLSDENFKLCADGIMLSKHKVTAKITWGAECKQYDTLITAETGLVGPSPAVRLRVAWNKLPSAFKENAQKVYKKIPAFMTTGWIKTKDENSVKQLSLTLVATSSRTINIIWKTPTRSVYSLAWYLPISLPLEELKGLAPFDGFIDTAHFIITKAGTAECSMKKDALTTFNNKRFRNDMPLSCYQVLVKDCTDEMKFMVLQKKDKTGQNHVNVKVADIDIDLSQNNTEIIVKVNGVEIPFNNLPYHHLTAKILISQNRDGVSIYAPSLGLHEVFFDKDSLKVKVVDWMKGQTCGLCGKADGEVRQEFRTPNQRVTKNIVSFAHSWVMVADSCRDTSECRMRLETVQLENQTIFQGQESKCFSVEPVLRCLSGCFPVMTTALTVGFHCLPADSNSNLSVGLSSTIDKSIDLRETIVAHLACSCTAQCA
ncbi:vitellogenin-1-like [Antennarius striatus]|uniref:vitellogenin-1-like n=1 Tax=Antennarius striatus TaxID=241820 RepID=UPI0035B10198